MPPPTQEKPAPRKTPVSTTQRIMMTRTAASRLRRQRQARLTRAALVLLFGGLLALGGWGLWRGLA